MINKTSLVKSVKLHNSQGHAGAWVLRSLLIDQEEWKEEYKDLLKQVKNPCEECRPMIIKRSAPPKPRSPRPRTSATS